MFEITNETKFLMIFIKRGVDFSFFFFMILTFLYRNLTFCSLKIVAKCFFFAYSYILHLINKSNHSLSLLELDSSTMLYDWGADE